MLKVVEKKKIWFSISLVIIAIGLAFTIIRGLNFGIDFVGGTKLVVSYEDGFDKEATDKEVKNYANDAVTNTINDDEYEIKSKNLDSTTVNQLVAKLQSDYKVVEIVSQDEVGASFGKDLTKNSLIALGLAFIAMLIYIAYRFEFKFGIAALVGLIHDVLITIAIYAIFDIAINTPFVAAILTIVGYSINATIVIFDRIRENIKISRRSNIDDVVNKSINKTIARSINTTITTLFTIGAVLILVPSVRSFTLPITVGILSGTYSSIFIAPSVYSLMKNKFGSKKKVSVIK